MHTESVYTGLITLNDWCTTIEDATELKLPWRLLRPRVADLDPTTGLVKYNSTFQDETSTTEASVFVYCV